MTEIPEHLLKRAQAARDKAVKQEALTEKVDIPFLRFPNEVSIPVKETHIVKEADPELEALLNEQDSKPFVPPSSVHTRTIALQAACDFARGRIVNSEADVLVVAKQFDKYLLEG